MGLIIWLIVGGVLGWLASIVMKRDGQQGILLNIVVGIVGAFLGGFLLSPLLGGGTINVNDFSVNSLIVSFLGAVILLAIVNLIKRGSVR
ncbi:MAG: GlsB/YeaQ/YmgE family stress response membrane protein [Burkholderiales bacterium]|nr:GlsB/YeaQ/YmgE family stress response membrane protein [Burkholderiales bacterium]MBK8666611.1 GlsB/YeaQ/YmgE family stress response membrane protein [Burkholderiales bacterium]